MKKVLMALALTALIAFPASAVEIDGAYVTIDPATADVGTAELCFFVQNDSSDAEWIGYFNFVLPDCMTILDSPAAWYSDPDASFYEVPVFSGYGTNVGTWEAWTSSGYGFLGSDDNGYFYCTVQIDCACMMYTIGWTLTGDLWGSDPHTVTGNLDFEVTCTTPTDETTISKVKALY